MIISDLLEQFEAIKQISGLHCFPTDDRGYESSNFIKHYVERQADYGDFKVLRIPTLHEMAVAQGTVVANDDEGFMAPLVSPSEGGKNNVEMVRCVKQAYQFGHNKFDITIEPFPVANHVKAVTAYVPPESHLSPQLVDMTIYDVLSIFPKSEAHLFALAVGRALCGPSKTQWGHHEEPSLTSPWRYMSIIAGQPKVGKSYLMSCLIDAMENLGYKTSAFAQLGKQFGIGKIVADGNAIAYSDDLNAKSLQNLLASITFKSIVSGAEIRVEEKNIAETTVKPTAVLFANINNFSSASIFNIDQGALSRLNILKTHSLSQLRSLAKEATGLSFGSPSLSSYQHLEYLRETYSVTNQEIFNKFFRLCADYYYNHVAAGSLEQEITEHKSMCKFQVLVDVFGSFAALLQFSYLALDRDAKETNVPPVLTGLSFKQSISALSFLACSNEAHKMRSLIKQHYINSGRNNGHFWLVLRDINLMSAYEAGNKASFLSASESIDANKTIKLVLEDLRLSSSFKLAAHLESVTQGWSDSRLDYLHDYSDLTAEAKKLDLEYEIRFDVKHLFTSKFNRKAWAESLNS